MERTEEYGSVVKGGMKETGGKEKGKKGARNGRVRMEDSEDGRYVSSEERVRELVEKIAPRGSEGGSGTFEEKRRNRGSSSEGDEGNKKWRWDGENMPG